jgi:polysaccharide biosynthesis protein PslH
MGPRVLYVTNQSPYPPWSGGQRREYEIIRRLSESYEIELVLIGPGDLLHGTPRAALTEILGVQDVLAVRSDDYEGAVWARLPRRMAEHYASAAPDIIAEQLGRESFDLVHLEGFFHLQSLPEDTDVPISIYAENIEYDLQRQAELTWQAVSGPDWRACRAHELQAWGRAASIGVCTAEDLELLRRDYLGTGKVQLVPFGADHLGTAGGVSAKRQGSGTVSFVGNFGWFPSRDAANVLLTEIWPGIAAKYDSAELLLIGTGADGALRSAAAEQRNVRMISNVPDIGKYLLETDVFCCPLRFGGGIKMKIYEALRTGCAIVSTPPGTSGLPEAARIAIRTTALADMVPTIAELLSDRTELARSQQAALTASAALPTWREAAEGQDQLWRSALAPRAGT